MTSFLASREMPIQDVFTTYEALKGIKATKNVHYFCKTRCQVGTFPVKLVALESRTISADYYSCNLV